MGSRAARGVDRRPVRAGDRHPGRRDHPPGPERICSTCPARGTTSRRAADRARGRHARRAGGGQPVGPVRRALRRPGVATGGRAGHPCSSTAAGGNHPVPRLRRADPLSRVPAPARPPPRHHRAALPPRRSHGTHPGSVSALPQPADPLLRGGHPAGGGGGPPRFPRLRVGRLDSDAVAACRRFESIYDDFSPG